MLETDVGDGRGEGVGVGSVDVSFPDGDLSAATDQPAEYRARAPLVVRGIVYRLLKGGQGARLRLLTAFGGEGHRVAVRSRACAPKELRLQEARRLMLSESMGAAEPAFESGRTMLRTSAGDYRRHVGAPSMRDVERLREATTSSA